MNNRSKKIMKIRRFFEHIFSIPIVVTALLISVSFDAGCWIAKYLKNIFKYLLLFLIYIICSPVYFILIGMAIIGLLFGAIDGEVSNKD